MCVRLTFTIEAELGVLVTDLLSYGYSHLPPLSLFLHSLFLSH